MPNFTWQARAFNGKVANGSTSFASSTRAATTVARAFLPVNEDRAATQDRGVRAPRQRRRMRPLHGELGQNTSACSTAGPALNAMRPGDIVWIRTREPGGGRVSSRE
jgi:hypothetical protein